MFHHLLIIMLVLQVVQGRINDTRRTKGTIAKMSPLSNVDDSEIKKITSECASSGVSGKSVADEQCRFGLCVYRSTRGSPKEDIRIAGELIGLTMLYDVRRSLGSESLPDSCVHLRNSSTTLVIYLVFFCTIIYLF